MTEIAGVLDERLNEMIVALKNWQQVLCDHGYPESSRLLNIAALDLQMRLHRISDAELKAFCSAIQQRASQVTNSESRLSSLGQHFSDAQSLTPAQNVIIMRSTKRPRHKRDRG